MVRQDLNYHDAHGQWQYVVSKNRLQFRSMVCIYTIMYARKNIRTSNHMRQCDLHDLMCAKKYFKFECVGWRRIGYPEDLNLYVFDVPLTSDSVG